MHTDTLYWSSALVPVCTLPVQVKSCDFRIMPIVPCIRLSLDHIISVVPVKDKNSGLAKTLQQSYSTEQKPEQSKHGSTGKNNMTIFI